MLGAGIAPQAVADMLQQPLGEGLGQPVGEGFSKMSE